MAQISPRPRINALRSEEYEWRRAREFRHACIADDDRASAVSEWKRRDEHREVMFYPGAALVRVQSMPSSPAYEGERGGGRRAAITSFSERSRAAMLRLVAKLPQAERPILVTLTYPREWPKNPRVWKEHLDAFGKALRRDRPGASLIWKLEPQRRGAPHYHGMIYGAEWVDLEWLRNTWFRIVGSADLRHLRAGTKVERARSSKAAMAYASKKYMGKQVDLPAGWEGCGRLWGVIGRKDLPLVEPVRLVVPVLVLSKYRRAVRAWQRSRGIRVRANGSVSIFTTQHLQWCRLLQWANGEAYTPMDAEGSGCITWGESFRVKYRP